MKIEAVVHENGKILGHAIGEVTKEGELEGLVSAAIADFRIKNPGKSLFTEDAGGPTIEIRKP